MRSVNIEGVGDQRGKLEGEYMFSLGTFNRIKDTREEEMKMVKQDRVTLFFVPALIMAFAFNCLAAVPASAGVADKYHLRKGSAASVSGEKIKDDLQASQENSSGTNDGGAVLFDTAGKDYYPQIAKAIGNNADEAKVINAVKKLLEQDEAYFIATGGSSLEAFLQKAKQSLDAAEQRGNTIRTQPLIVSTDLFTASSQPGYLTGIALVGKYLGNRFNIVAVGRGNKIVNRLFADKPAVIDSWVNKSLFSNKVKDDGAYHGASMILADGEVPNRDLLEAARASDSSDWEIRLFSANTPFSWAVLGSAVSEAFPELLRGQWAEYWNNVPGAGKQVTSRNGQGMFNFDTGSVLSPEAQRATISFRKAAFDIFSTSDFAGATGADVDSASLMLLARKRGLDEQEAEKIVSAANNLRKQDSIVFQRELAGAEFDAFLASAAAELDAAEKDGKTVATQTIAVSSTLFNKYQQGYMTPLALVKRHLGKRVNLVVFGPGAETIKAILGNKVDAVENKEEFLKSVGSYKDAMVVLAKGETADARLHEAAREGKLKLMAANTYLSSVVIGNAVAKLFPGMLMDVWKQFFVSIREAGVITEQAYKAGYDDVVKHSWVNVKKIDDVFQFNGDMDMSVASKLTESAEVYATTSQKAGIGV